MSFPSLCFISEPLRCREKNAPVELHISPSCWSCVLNTYWPRKPTRGTNIGAMSSPALSVMVSYVAILHWNTSPQLSLKANERSPWCKRCMCQTQTESQSWVCTTVGGRQWLSFAVAWGCAGRCWDGLQFPVSSTSNLPCDTTAARRTCIVCQDPETVLGSLLSAVQGTVWHLTRDGFKLVVSFLNDTCKVYEDTKNKSFCTHSL